MPLQRRSSRGLRRTLDIEDLAIAADSALGRRVSVLVTFETFQNATADRAVLYVDRRLLERGPGLSICIDDRDELRFGGEVRPLYEGMPAIDSRL